MRFRIATIAGIALIAAIGFAGSAQAQGTATFDVSGTHFSLPIPKGYCLPTTPKDVERMRFAASIDKENLTALSLVACGGEPDLFDYILLKTPVSMLSGEITLRELMASLGPDFDKPVGDDMPLGDTAEMMGDALTKRTGTEYQIAVAVGPRGRDEVCAYSGGTITATNLGQVISLGTCTTVVSGRMFSIHSYARGGDPALVRPLLARGRALALTMSGKK